MNASLKHSDHKYIAKIGEGKDARHFYSQAELDAYMKDTQEKSIDEARSVREETAKFVEEHPEYREQWLKEIGSEENQEYDPEKEKNLLQRMKNDEVEKRRKRKEEDVLKHSDDDITSLMTYSAELYHYGRKGMKWYQHIYGPVQSVAKYAKKAGSKMAEAKQKHDTKAEAKWEAKKEKVIRSGNAKAIRKISDKLTDDELRRADNRINEKNRLDSMTGRQQQGQQFVQQKGNQNSSDFINDFNSFVNKATSTYNSIDKLVKTYDDIQKYMPENRAKEARVKEITRTADVLGLIQNQKDFSDDQIKAFNNRLKNMTSIYDTAASSGALNGRHNSYNSGKHYSNDVFNSKGTSKKNKSNVNAQDVQKIVDDYIDSLDWDEIMNSR